jgi:hypothetical protein
MKCVQICFNFAFNPSLRRYNQVYNHHIVVFSRPDAKLMMEAAAAAAAAAALAAENMVPAGGAEPPDMVGPAGYIGKSAARLAKGLSSVLTPCGTGGPGGNYFTGGGAEWRGRQVWENTLGPFNGGRAAKPYTPNPKP